MTECSSQIGRDQSAFVAGGLIARSTGLTRLGDHMTMSKMGITRLVVITAFIGFAMGVRADDQGWSWLTLAAAMIGTAFSCMGAGVLNHLLERDTDALMERTKDRPLPAGRISPREAALSGAMLSIAGVLVLGWGANWLAALFSAFTIFSYVFIYTPMKRVNSLSTLIGAVPGAMPPIIGYAAATHRVGVEAVLLFAIMFIWQLPHFLALGWLYREDYARAGLRILPVVDPDGRRTFRQITFYSAALTVVGILPTLMGVSGVLHFFVALVCGGVFLAFALRLAVTPTRHQARALFLASLIYLPIVLTTMLLNQL